MTAYHVITYMLQTINSLTACCLFVVCRRVVIVQYNDLNPSLHPPQLMNPLNQKATPTLIQMADLNTMIPDDPRMKTKPDKKFYVAMDFYRVDNYHFHDPDLYSMSKVAKQMHLLSPQMNHISMTMPSAPPLTQYSDLNEVGVLLICC